MPRPYRCIHTMGRWEVEVMVAMVVEEAMAGGMAVGGRAAAAEAAMEVVVTVVVAGSATVVEGTEVVATVTVVALPAATERVSLGWAMKVGAEEQMVAKAEAMGQHTSHRSQLHQEMHRMGCHKDLWGCTSARHLQPSPRRGCRRRRSDRSNRESHYGRAVAS